VPELWDNTLATDPTPPTYTTQVGEYIRIGNLVTIQGTIVISSLGGLTTSQNLRVGGLPYAAKNTTNLIANIAVGRTAGMSLPSASTLTGYIVGNQSYITMRLNDTTVGNSNLKISEFSATGDISFSASYIVD
jgi:hypothetical protein